MKQALVVSASLLAMPVAGMEVWHSIGPSKVDSTSINKQALIQVNVDIFIKDCEENESSLDSLLRQLLEGTHWTVSVREVCMELNPSPGKSQACFLEQHNSFVETVQKLSFSWSVQSTAFHGSDATSFLLPLQTEEPQYTKNSRTRTFIVAVWEEEVPFSVENKKRKRLLAQRLAQIPRTNSLFQLENNLSPDTVDGATRSNTVKAHTVVGITATSRRCRSSSNRSMKLTEKLPPNYSFLDSAWLSGVTLGLTIVVALHLLRLFLNLLKRNTVIHGIEQQHRPIQTWPTNDHESSVSIEQPESVEDDDLPRSSDDISQEERPREQSKGESTHHNVGRQSDSEEHVDSLGNGDPEADDEWWRDDFESEESAGNACVVENTQILFSWATQKSLRKSESSTDDELGRPPPIERHVVRPIPSQGITFEDEIERFNSLSLSSPFGSRTTSSGARSLGRRVTLNLGSPRPICWDRPLLFNSPAPARQLFTFGQPSSFVSSPRNTAVPMTSGDSQESRMTPLPELRVSVGIQESDVQQMDQARSDLQSGQAQSESVFGTQEENGECTQSIYTTNDIVTMQGPPVDISADVTIEPKAPFKKQSVHSHLGPICSKSGLFQVSREAPMNSPQPVPFLQDDSVHASPCEAATRPKASSSCSPQLLEASRTLREPCSPRKTDEAIVHLGASDSSMMEVMVGAGFPCASDTSSKKCSREECFVASQTTGHVGESEAERSDLNAQYSEAWNKIENTTLLKKPKSAWASNLEVGKREENQKSQTQKLEVNRGGKVEPLKLTRGNDQTSSRLPGERTPEEECLESVTEDSPPETSHGNAKLSFSGEVGVQLSDSNAGVREAVAKLDQENRAEDAPSKSCTSVVRVLEAKSELKSLRKNEIEESRLDSCQAESSDQFKGMERTSEFNVRSAEKNQPEPNMSNGIAAAAEGFQTQNFNKLEEFDPEARSKSQGVLWQVESGEHSIVTEESVLMEPKQPNLFEHRGIDLDMTTRTRFARRGQKRPRVTQASEKQLEDELELDDCLETVAESASRHSLNHVARKAPQLSSRSNAPEENRIHEADSLYRRLARTTDSDACDSTQKTLSFTYVSTLSPDSFTSEERDKSPCQNPEFDAFIKSNDRMGYGYIEHATSQSTSHQGSVRLSSTIHQNNQDIDNSNHDLIPVTNALAFVSERHGQNNEGAVAERVESSVCLPEVAPSISLVTITQNLSAPVWEFTDEPARSKNKSRAGKRRRKSIKPEVITIGFAEKSVVDKKIHVGDSSSETDLCKSAENVPLSSGKSRRKCNASAGARPANNIITGTSVGATTTTKCKTDDNTHKKLRTTKKLSCLDGQKKKSADSNTLSIPRKRARSRSSTG